MADKDVNIRFFTYARFSDKALLASHCVQTKFEKNFKEEAMNLLKKLEPLQLLPEQRQKVSTQNGAWYCTVDTHNIVYLVLTQSNYPERHAYGMINEMRKHIEAVNNYWNETESNIHKTVKKPVQESVKKYDDLKSLDKLYAAQEKVNEITDVMQENTKKMLENVQSVEGIEHKTIEMKSLSQQFHKQSDELAVIMKQRNRKLQMILACIVAGVVIYIISSIF